MVKKLLSISLLFSGFLVLIVSFIADGGWGEFIYGEKAKLNQQTLPHKLPVDSIFDSRDYIFLNKPYVKNSDIIGLFMIHDKLCPSSVNEIYEYGRVLRRNDSLRIKPVTVVVSAESEESARRYLDVTSFEMPSGYGYSTYVDETLNLSGDGLIPKMLLVEARSGELLYSGLLSPNKTSVETKKSMLNSVLSGK